MNWYKRAQQVDLTGFIADWIRSSAEFSQDVSAFQEQATAHAGNMVDPGDFRASVTAASNQVAMEQGGQLTLQQQEFVKSISTVIVSDPVPEVETPMETTDGSF